MKVRMSLRHKLLIVTDLALVIIFTGCALPARVSKTNLPPDSASIEKIQEADGGNRPYAVLSVDETIEYGGGIVGPAHYRAYDPFKVRERLLSTRLFRDVSFAPADIPNSASVEVQATMRVGGDNGAVRFAKGFLAGLFLGLAFPIPLTADVSQEVTVNVRMGTVSRTYASRGNASVQCSYTMVGCGQAATLVAPEIEQANLNAVINQLVRDEALYRALRLKPE